MEEQRPWDGSPLIFSSLRDSYPPICAIQSSGLFETFGLADGEAGFLDRTERDQLWESWHLQMDRVQQKIHIPSNMPIESLTKLLLLTSGLFEPLELADGEAGFLDRTERDQLRESWHLQMDQQLQQKIHSNMPIESLTKLLLLTSGEYLNVHIKAFNYLNNERERSNVITINNKRKRSNVITLSTVGVRLKNPLRLF